MRSISVIGAGAWGTALSLAILRAGQPVTLFSTCDARGVPFSPPHENIRAAASIPNCPLLDLTTDVEVTATSADIMLFAPPAQHMREICAPFAPLLSTEIPLIIASKGIEESSALLMSEVVREFFPSNPLLILSGPSFAEDVTQNLPTMVTLAAEDLAVSQRLAALLASSSFHLIPSDDLIGAQLGGAIKNIIAIACGIVEGRGLGDNARAAILAQGLVEIANLGQKMGAKLETFLGLAGVGDITLTSYGAQSRNKSFGYALGQGTPLRELLEQENTLTEGVHTVFGALKLAKMHKVAMPVTEALHHLLSENGTLGTFFETLLGAKS